MNGLMTIRERYLAGLPARDHEERERYDEYNACASDADRPEPAADLRRAEGGGGVTNAALAALLAFLAAFVFCALASMFFGWHTAITRPATAACAVGLVACAVWLNRSAS